MEDRVFVKMGETDVPLRDCWRTPRWLVDALACRWQFGLDAAASINDRVLPIPYIGPDHTDPRQRDALEVSWSLISVGHPVFLNPPYSQASGGIFGWVNKAIMEGKKVPVVAVLPDTISCKWFKLAMETAYEVHFFSRRVGFDPPPGVPKSSPRAGTVVFCWAPRIAGPARVRWDELS